jgi:methyl-accepting chemotaxis protein
MKKRFLTLLAGIVLILSLGTTFVIYHIEQAIYSLDHLVERYEKDRKCTQILMAIKKVQQDILLHHSYSTEETLAIADHLEQFSHKRGSCVTCHHPEPIEGRIRVFSNSSKAFQTVVSGVFERPVNNNHQGQDLQAFAMGQELGEQAQALFQKSAQELAVETSVARSLTVESKVMLYVITCLGLAFVVFISFMLIRSFTKPLQSLLTATAKIKQGDFDYRVSGLKYEFGELADSFNTMSASLKKQMVQLQESEQLAACGKIATSLVHEVQPLGWNQGRHGGAVGGIHHCRGGSKNPAAGGHRGAPHRRIVH